MINASWSNRLMCDFAGTVLTLTIHLRIFFIKINVFTMSFTMSFYIVEENVFRSLLLVEIL